MTGRERRILDTMLRVQNFKKRHIADFQTNGTAAKCFAKNDQFVQEAEDFGLIQRTGDQTAHGAVAGKTAQEMHLRTLIRAIVNTGRRAFRENAALEKQFRNPRFDNNTDLLTDAKALRNLANTHKQVFLDAEMPADFIDELDEAIADWDDAEDDKDDGDQESAGATKAVGKLLREALANIRDADPPVRNRYRDNAQVIGEWETASHLEVAGRTSNATGETTNTTP